MLQSASNTNKDDKALTKISGQTFGQMSKQLLFEQFDNNLQDKDAIVTPRREEKK